MHTELRTNSESEDEERIAAEIAELVTKIKRIYQQESRAKRQAQAIAKRSAPKQGPASNENVHNYASRYDNSYGLWNRCKAIADTLGWDNQKCPD